MGWRVTEAMQPFSSPGGRIAMEGHPPIGQPSQVAGEGFPGHRSHADDGEQLTADAARLEVDERGGTNIEGEAAPPEEAGAATGLAMSLQNDRGQTSRLEPCCARHPCHSGTDDC